MIHSVLLYGENCCDDTKLCNQFLIYYIINNKIINILAEGFFFLLYVYPCLYDDTLCFVTFNLQILIKNR